MESREIGNTEYKQVRKKKCSRLGLYLQTPPPVLSLLCILYTVIIYRMMITVWPRGALLFGDVLQKCFFWFSLFFVSDKNPGLGVDRDFETHLRAGLVLTIRHTESWSRPSRSRHDLRERVRVSSSIVDHFPITSNKLTKYQMNVCLYSGNKKRRGSVKGKCHVKTMMITKVNEGLKWTLNMCLLDRTWRKKYEGRS